MMHAATRKGPIAGAVRDELARALEQSGGNVREASKKLGMSERTAHRWIKALGLRPTLKKTRRDAAPQIAHA
jgi:transcriptional regulator of acetoin/glycerol metabolism